MSGKHVFDSLDLLGNERGTCVTGWPIFPENTVIVIGFAVNRKFVWEPNVLSWKCCKSHIRLGVRRLQGGGPTDLRLGSLKFWKWDCVGPSMHSAQMVLVRVKTRERSVLVGAALYCGVLGVRFCKTWIFKTFRPPRTERGVFLGIWTEYSCKLQNLTLTKRIHRVDSLYIWLLVHVPAFCTLKIPLGTVP